MKRFTLIIVLFFIPFTFFSNPAWSETQKWKVNLKDADIRAFITQISDITGYSFVVDPRVKGKVTVISNVSMDKNAIYEMFLSVLQVHGYTAIPSQDVIKIVQQNSAKQSAVNLKLYKQIPAQQLVTRVIKVNNANALELVPILRPMVARYGHLAGVASANALIISDELDNILRISRIVKKLDTPSHSGLEVVQLKEAWVGNMVKLLEELAPAELGKSSIKASARKYSVVADERSNRLIIRGDKQFRKKIKQLIEKLDQPAATSGSTKVIKLKYADAKKLAKMLKGLMGDIVSDTKSNKGPKNKKIVANVYADVSMNALVIRAAPSVMREVERIVAQLDQRQPQVMIEAAIVEIADNNSKGLGIQWGLFDKNGTVPGLSTNFSEVGLSAAQVLTSIGAGTPIPPAVGGASLVLGKSNKGGVSWGALIQALASSSNINLLSTPKIITMDNQEASIIVGQNIPIKTGQSTSTGNGLSNPFTTISRQDVGVKLKVTPSISEGSTVKLKIKQEISSVEKGISSTSGIITNKREIKTTVLANDGETIVLGGLITDDVTEKQSKVPLLGDIPYLGTLFRSSETVHSKRNLLVFLRPTILRNKMDDLKVTQRKFNELWKLNLSRHKKSGWFKQGNKKQTVVPKRPSVDVLFKSNPVK